jgi:hypothetical protein
MQAHANARAAMCLSTMTAQTRPATYQDVLDAPENMTAEIIDGELPRPWPPHVDTRAFTRRSPSISAPHSGTEVAGEALGVG